MMEAQSVPGREPQTPAGVEDATYRSFGVSQTGDGKAMYALLSQQCRRAVGSRLEYALHVQREVSYIELFTGWKFAEMTLLDVRVVDFTVDRASVATTYDLGDGTLWRRDDDPSVFVYEKGYWKTECDE